MFEQEELLLKIFAYLNPKELAVLALVTKQWQRIAYDSQLWKQFLYADQALQIAIQEKHKVYSYKQIFTLFPNYRKSQFGKFSSDWKDYIGKQIYYYYRLFASPAEHEQLDFAFLNKESKLAPLLYYGMIDFIHLNIFVSRRQSRIRIAGIFELGPLTKLLSHEKIVTLIMLKKIQTRHLFSILAFSDCFDFLLQLLIHKDMQHTLKFNHFNFNQLIRIIIKETSQESQNINVNEFIDKYVKANSNNHSITYR